MPKDKIKRSGQLLKQYEYEADGLKLSFSLFIDKPASLKTFKLLLEAGLEELNQDIEAQA